jgi:hypothetical protein
MSKHTITREIAKELKMINDRIDRKIIKGHSYQEEARHHRELLATMRQLSEEKGSMVPVPLRTSRVGKSPVRRSLSGSSFFRLFRMSVA